MTMDRPDDTSKPHSGSNHNAADAPSSAALPTHLQQRIDAQRAQLLQAHGVLRCLHTVLLHAECDDAVFYADTASVVANLINNSAEELDSVHLR
jgi:hypothetical protein